MPKNEGYELKAVDTSAISEWDPQVLSDMVDTKARRNRVIDAVIAETHDRTGDTGSTFEVRERGALDVQTQSENTQISTEDLSYSTTEISVSKYGESVEITREAEEDGLDVQQDDVAEELGEAFADSQDQTAYDTLVGNGSVPTTTLNSNGQLTRDEIVDIRATVLGNNYDADSIVVHPSMEAELLKIDDFVHADQYGEQVVDDGELGRLYGMTVYASTTANAKSQSNNGNVQLAVVDSDRCLHRLVKRGITIELEQEERFDRDTVVGTARWGHSVVNPDAAAFLVNST